MPARKTTKKAASKKKSIKKKAARPETGPVPPYGDPIRKAIARGNTREMKTVAASARKWLSDVQTALEQLEGALKKK
ncbi:MAG TPA: DUF1843 domain-containing protein [Pyrinomonadaceae bacterium]|jgi:hypothetical protein|nr:DUF1843 domain-containing protein [Pyrinomonadaceae bacterium]